MRSLNENAEGPEIVRKEQQNRRTHTPHQISRPSEALMITRAGADTKAGGQGHGAEGSQKRAGLTPAAYFQPSHQTPQWRVRGSLVANCARTTS